MPDVYHDAFADMQLKMKANNNLYTYLLKETTEKMQSTEQDVIHALHSTSVDSSNLPLDILAIVHTFLTHLHKQESDATPNAHK